MPPVAESSLAVRADSHEQMAAGVLFLRENASAREQQIANALKYVQANSWDVEKNRYLGIVDSLAARKSRLHQQAERYC